METKTFRVPNIGCEACVSKIREELEQLGGVIHAAGDTTTKVVTVHWEEPASWEVIWDRLTEIDYAPART